MFLMISEISTSECRIFIHHQQYVCFLLEIKGAPAVLSLPRSCAVESLREDQQSDVQLVNGISLAISVL